MKYVHGQPKKKLTTFLLKGSITFRLTAYIKQQFSKYFSFYEAGSLNTQMQHLLTKYVIKSLIFKTRP